MILKFLNHFKIENRKIEFFPMLMWRVVGYFLLICFIGFSIWLYTLTGLNGFLVSLIASFIICAPFILAGMKKIIFDETTATLYRKSIFGKKTICHFREIDRVDFVQDVTYGANGNGHYAVYVKDNLVGSGIRLCPNLNGSSKAILDVERVAIPHVLKLLEKHPVAPSVQNQSVDDFIMFRKNHGAFVSKKFKTISLSVGILLVLLGVWYAFTVGWEHKDKHLFYGLFFVLIGLLNISFWASVVSFDIKSRTIATSDFFGLSKKKIAFDDIANLYTLSHKIYGIIPNGTDVLADMKNGKRFTLLSKIGSKKQLNSAVNEINQILGMG